MGNIHSNLIYIEHPVNTVIEVMQEFREFMHSPECTSTSLSTSILLLDFYTYYNTLDEYQTGILDGLFMEAEMRIDLMVAVEEPKASKEARMTITTLLNRLYSEIRYIHYLTTAYTPTYDELIEYINKKKLRGHNV